MASVWQGAALLLAAVTAVTAVTAVPAVAGPLDGLESAVTGNGATGNEATGSGVGGGILGALGSGSFQPLSLHNVAGIMAFCEKQGFSGSASAVAKQQLLARLGVAPERDESYRDGLGGLLQGKDGTNFSLGGLKKEVGRKVCSALAKQALSSVLGL